MALALQNLLRLKMCWKVERYYSQCGHWADPVIEKFCAKGLSDGLACDESKVNSESLPLRRMLCPKCAYQHNRNLPGVAFTHRFNDDGPSVPFSRDSLNAKPLAMAKEEREKIAQEAADSKLRIKKEAKIPFRSMVPDLSRLKTEEIDRQLWMEQERGKESLHERLKKRDSEAAEEQERQAPSKPPFSTKEETSQQVPALGPRLSKLALPVRESKNAN